jgi:hypothetical protein
MKNIEMTEASACRTVIRIYSLFRSERLSNTLQGTDQISNDLRLPHLGISGRHLPLKLQHM